MSYCVSRTLLRMRLTMGVCHVLYCVRLTQHKHKNVLSVMYLHGHSSKELLQHH